MLNRDVRQAVELRQAGMKNEFEEWMEADLQFYQNIGCVKQVITMRPPKYDGATEDTFQNLMDENHHLNRELIRMLSTDLQIFQEYQAFMTAGPSETLIPRVFNDCLLHDSAIETRYAEDFIGVGYLKQSDYRYRPHCAPDHNVSVKEQTGRHFDKKPATASKALIDFTICEQRSIYIGGTDDWEHKISPKPDESRNPIHWDYEPIKSVKIGDEWVHTRDSLEANQQVAYIRARANMMNTNKLDWLVCLCPLRHASYMIKQHNVRYVLPAFQPAVMSVILYIKPGKPTRGSVGLSSLLELAVMMAKRQEYVLASFENGRKGMTRLMKRKLGVEFMEGIGSVISYWHKILVARYVTHASGSSGITVTMNLKMLLKATGSDKIKKAIAGIERHQMASFPRLIGRG